MSNKILTPTTLAERWGFSTTTIWRMEKKGELPPRKRIHKRAVWLESDIEEFEANLPEVDSNSMELVK